MASFVTNVNTLASKIDIVEEANSIFDEGVIPVLEEIAELDLQEAVSDLKKGNYLGNRKIDINLALNMVGIDEDLLEKDPDAAEAIWTNPAKTVLYDRATITFVDGEVIDLPFEFDGNPTTISTHGDLLIQLGRYDTVDPVAQQVVVNNIVAVNSTLYRITINGINYDYTSDADATVPEIVSALVQEINVTETNGSVPVTAVDGVTSITLVADVAGAAFTVTGNGNMLVTTTVANVVGGSIENAFLAKLESTLVAGFASDIVGEIVRLYDVIGQNSNIERIRLHAVSGAYREENPIYYWAKTTSAFQTLSMRAGDIIKLGNELDNLILLANSIEQVLEIQARIPEFIDTYVDNVAQGDVTIYNKLAELQAIYDNLTQILTVYSKLAEITTVNNNITAVVNVSDDLDLGASSRIVKVGDNIEAIIAVDTNETNINTVSNSISSVVDVAADLDLGVASKIANVSNNMSTITAVDANETNINAVNANEANINAIVTNIIPNLAEILATDEQAAIAVANADLAIEAKDDAETAKAAAEAAATTATAKSNEIKSVSVGSTITGAAGTNASVVYNPADGKFTFIVPQGVKGDKGDAFEVNAVGLLANKSLYDAQQAGFSFLATDTAEIYFKLSNTSGDWSVGASFGKGDTGETGAVGNGIADITFTSSSLGGLAGQSGATDTYTITYTDTTTDTFVVYNGLDSAVQSVAGRTGDVVLTEADITDLDKYTKAEVDAKDATKADLVHTHVEADITDLDKYTKAEVDAKTSIDGLSDTTITTPTDGQALVYDTATSKWVNAEAGGGIGEFIDTSIAISSDGSALANDDGTANDNIAIGFSSSPAITTGSDNVAIGAYTLYNAVSTVGQVGIGNSTLKNSTGNNNTGVGATSLYLTTTGICNVGFGHSSGNNITTGSYNTALGTDALTGNATSKLTGSYNTGIGYQTGLNLTTGQYNVLMGHQAGYNLTSGWDNISIGKYSLNKETGGIGNIAIGSYALEDCNMGAFSQANNVAIGTNAGANLTTGTSCVFIGNGAGSSFNSGDNVTILGNAAAASSSTVSNEITIGNSSITSLRCQVTTITSLSDERDKDNIQDLDTGLDFINSLRPVRFDWNMRDGGKVGENDIGFIAQELQQAQKDSNTTVPHLVMDENPDKLEAGYGMLIAPLVKAVQELSAEVELLKQQLNK